MTHLTAAQQAMVEFLRLDQDLLTAAAAASPASTNDSAAARRWRLALKPCAKHEWLERAITNPDLALGTELRRTFQQQTKAPLASPQRRVEVQVDLDHLRRQRGRGFARSWGDAKDALSYTFRALSSPTTKVFVGP